MAADLSVMALAGGAITAFITASGAAVVAFINNRRERSGAAESSLVLTLRERILLRDEKIEMLEEENSELEEENGELLVENSDLKQRIRELEADSFESRRNA
jgi:predicted RNase H-like nuclease (RuvC/YqgF family)